MVSDHINYLTFEDPGAVHTVRRALKLAHAGDLYGAAETAGVDVAHAAVVSDGLRKGMRFSIGAEVDNDPRARPDAQNIVDAMRPDGIIRSVHFLAIDHPEKGADFAWPYDNVEFAELWQHVGVERAWELYVDRLVEDIEKLPGHIVGHFYKPAVFGHWPDDAKLQSYEDRMLDAAASRGMAVEINTRPLYKETPGEDVQKYAAVNKRLMRKAKAKGVGIAIGSDAHSPKDQAGGFDAVLAMLDECDINEIVFPVGGRLARVVLRATQEHLQQNKPQETVQAGSSISGFSRAELGLPEEPERSAEEKLREAPGSKAARDSGPKKRASSPARTTKKPAATEPAPKSSSKRSAESAASSAQAKDVKETEAAKPASTKSATPKTPAAKKPAKAETAKAAAPAKNAAPAKKAAVPVKKAATTKAAPPAKKAVATAKKAVDVKKGAPAKKAPPAKPAAQKKTASVKKTAPAKKAPAKKTAAKPAAKAKRPAAKPVAKKSPAKKATTSARAVKSASKPSSKGTTKKKSTKRR
jgi:HisJ family histidinol phosphate phosphatase